MHIVVVDQKSTSWFSAWLKTDADPIEELFSLSKLKRLQSVIKAKIEKTLARK